MKLQGKLLEEFAVFVNKEKQDCYEKVNAKLIYWLESISIDKQVVNTCICSEIGSTTDRINNKYNELRFKDDSVCIDLDEYTSLKEQAEIAQVVKSKRL